jgi:hypothetical protein
MVTPLLNKYKQWLVINDTNGIKSQMVLIDERGQPLKEVNCDAMNVTLVGTDQIAFLTIGCITVIRRYSSLNQLNRN